MVEIVEIAPEGDHTSKLLAPYIQSGNINFLIGSGASFPAIVTAGNIETEINTLIADGDAEGASRRCLDFIEQIDTVHSQIPAAPEGEAIHTVAEHYKTFLSVIDRILFTRKNIILPRQATIFTTIRKVFDPDPAGELFTSNVVVIALGDCNLEMKKTIPLLVAKKIYDDHKQLGPNRSLNIVIDEAHNILSRESFRESESWKDYRLETFEEIIKEGRKFGVFVTISSQRPNDISHTITSQAHNYFIHRLINQRDLQSIASAVSYIDKLTEESIPTLPTGTCIFSGVAGQMPLKLAIRPLAEQLQPRSATIKFQEVVPAA
jgi:DNA helicase HerA-like ATPase